MNIYTNLTALINRTAADQQRITIDRMSCGQYADQVLKNHSTDTRWDQYTGGQITREKAIEYATKRIIKDSEKWIARQLDKLETVDSSAEITNFSVYVKWTRSRIWGYNPTATVYAQDSTGKTWTATGKASGCGYDKLSTAICEALNQIPGLLKDLYTVKENAIADGTTPTAEINESNTKYIAYGAGYGALPYFEGGCGSTTTATVLEKCGFKVSFHGDNLTGYKIEGA